MRKEINLSLKSMGCLVFCLLILLLTVAGCGSAKKNQTPEKGQPDKEKGEIWLYYLNASEDGFETVPYKLENANDVVLSAYEIVYKLSETESSHTSSYKPAVFDGITVNLITEEDGELIVDMGAGYRQLTPVKEILLRTALVKSLTQMENVKSVVFTINGDSLLGSDENPVGAMKGDTFLLENDVDILYEERKEATLYYANEDGDGLVEYNMRLVTENGMNMETKALLSLLSVPEDLKGQSPLPHDLVVNSIQIHNKVCYVDVNKAIENVLPGVEEKVMIYAMVNTITSLGNATSVQFTVDGKKLKSIRDFDSFHLLLTNDYSLCDNPKGKR